MAAICLTHQIRQTDKLFDFFVIYDKLTNATTLNLETNYPFPPLKIM